MFCCVVFVSWVPSFTMNGMPPLATTNPDTFFYKSDTKYSIKFEYPKLGDFNQTVVIKRVSDKAKTNGRIIYTPFNPNVCPENSICPSLINPRKGPLLSDLWLCYSNLTNNICYPIGFHNAFTIILPGQVRDNNGNPLACQYKLKGFGDINTIVEIGYKSSPMIQEEIEFNDVNNEFKVFIYSPLAISVNVVDPQTPVFQNMSPPMEHTYISDDFLFFEQTPNDYISYRMDLFDTVIMNVTLILSHTTNHIQVFMKLGGLIPCPESYNCTFSNNSVSSIWKCWISHDEHKYCYPIADFRYGFDMRSTLIHINGGINKYSVDISLKCNQLMPNNTVKLSKSASEDLLKKIVFEATGSDFCPKKFVPISYEKKPTLGGYMITYMWIVVIVVVFGGIVYNYLFLSRFSLPFNRIIGSFLSNMYKGYNIVTCNNRHTDPKENKSNQQESHIYSAL